MVNEVPTFHVPSEFCKLTGLTFRSMERLQQFYGDILVHDISESLIESNNIVRFETGIGNLYIKLYPDTEEYTCVFEPSGNFRRGILDVMRDAQHRPVKELEDKIVSELRKKFGEELYG